LLAATAAAFLATLSAAFISLAASLLATTVLATTALLATGLFTATTLIFFTIVWHISPLDRSDLFRSLHLFRTSLQLALITSKENATPHHASR
jgi:hypothetical protein